MNQTSKTQEQKQLLSHIQNFLKEIELIEENFAGLKKRKDKFSLKRGNSYIYNEISLQHELGIYLRNIYQDKGYRVEFERNSSKFVKSTTTKHEIDIVIYNKDTNLAAIELKFPRNGQYPESMYSFVKDICFLEELCLSDVTSRFSYGISLVIVDDRNFYAGISKRIKKIATKSIYQYFRVENEIGNSVSIKPKEIKKDKPIEKPTGNKESELIPKNNYQIEWLPFKKSSQQPFKYYLIEVKNN